MMLKLKPLWLKMIYTGVAGLIMLFILSFNFKEDENLVFKTNLKGLHKMDQIKSEIASYQKSDIYGEKDLMLKSKINAYLVNDLISIIEADNCRSDLKNRRISFIIDKCLYDLKHGDYNNIDKKTLTMLNTSELEGTSFASDAANINRNYNAIDYYLKQLKKELFEYISGSYYGLYFDSNYDNNDQFYLTKIQNIPNLDLMYKSNSKIKQMKRRLEEALNKFSYDIAVSPPTDFNEIEYRIAFFKDLLFN